MNGSDSVLGVFVKQPVAGRVKTRLAAAIGDERAAEIYAAFQHDVLDSVRGLGDRRVLGFAPNDADSREYFTGIGEDAFDLWPQPDVSLGERMAAFFEHEFASGAERVVLIGSDSPNLPGEIIQQAFVALAEKDCVIGPATDGGYYLIGFRSRARSHVQRMFANIKWSTHQVLGQTVERIREANISLSIMPPWYDIDTVEDLAILRSHIAATGLAGGNQASRTAELLEKLAGELDLALTPPVSG